MGWTLPGPLGKSVFAGTIEDQTLARTWSFPPGPGNLANPAVSAQSKINPTPAKSNKPSTPSSQNNASNSQLASLANIFKEALRDYTKDQGEEIFIAGLIAGFDVLLNVVAPKLIAGLPRWAGDAIVSILRNPKFMNALDERAIDTIEHPQGVFGLTDPYGTLAKIVFSVMDSLVDECVSDPYNQMWLHILFGLAAPVGVDLLDPRAGKIDAVIDAAIFAFDEWGDVFAAFKKYKSTYSHMLAALAVCEYSCVQLRERADQLAKDTKTVKMADRLRQVADEVEVQSAKNMKSEGYSYEYIIASLLAKARYWQDKGDLTSALSNKSAAFMLAVRLDNQYFNFGPTVDHISDVGWTGYGLPHNASIQTGAPQTFQVTVRQLSVLLGVT